MTDQLDSDDYPGLNLSQFTEEDFATIDAAVASKLLCTQDDQNGVSGECKVASIISEQSERAGSATSATEIAPQDDIEEKVADSSFQSDMFDLNLKELSAEQLALLDAPVPMSDKILPISDRPSIEIEIEGLDDASLVPLEHNKPFKPYKSWHDRNPLERFRSHMSLSVTDLVSLSWCEVQFDYGLRGKRSRPVKERPKSFISAAGKTISPAAMVSKENEVRTRQGLAVHKALEREVKFDELKVDITTAETRWALRLVNMIACLRGIFEGFTREMPVFGIIHGEVVVGIMDEVVKVELPGNPDHSPDSKNFKRPSNKPHSTAGAKKARIDRPAWQTTIDRFFESPKKMASSASFVTDTEETSTPEKRVGYKLFIKDNKTRRSENLPSEDDMHSGRMQLMVYRRLLSELLATNPPYNFTPLWEKLSLDPTEIFPTKFLVQARLIEDNEEFPLACLDDLVDSWHKLVKEYNIVGVDPQLELVYRLRPPPDSKGKGKSADVPGVVEVDDGDKDLARAIANSLEDLSRNQTPIAGPSNLRDSAVISSVGPHFESEEAQLQWALQKSMLPQVPGGSEPIASLTSDIVAPTIGMNGRAKPATPPSIKAEKGIRRFNIVGTKTFLHDDVELDNHLTHALSWWRGERKSEGVDIEHSYRCSTCEYIEDCEWREEKALELASNKRKT